MDEGAPLFRLVDDLSWYLYVAVRGSRPLQSGRTVVVRYATGEVKMRVDRVEVREDKMMALRQVITFRSNACTCVRSM